jgi:site-specific DNA-methyltransferase (adenine-specific)
MATILLGNCLEKMKSFADKSVDLIICDLPYGCLSGRSVGTLAEEKKLYGSNYDYVKEKRNQRKRFINGIDTGTIVSSDIIGGCAWDIKIDLETFWKEVKRIRKNEHTPTIHFCTTKYGYELIKSNEKEYRYDIVYSKTNAVGFLSANKMPMRSHEMIYVFSKAGANYNRLDLSGNYPNTISLNHKRSNTSNVVPKVKDKSTSNEGKRCIKSVIEIKNTKGRGEHPTAKPIELYKFLIERYSKPGDTVLDPTFGSMNSGMACIELGRKYIGIEMNKTFFDKGFAKIVCQ